jgi:ATP-dependent Clp protease ATP-binding subunit ClpB
VRQIIRIQLKRVQKLLADQKITLELSPAAQDYLVDVGYDPVYGARPLKRAIQRELENPLVTKLLENAFTEGDTIMVDYVDSSLSFSRGGKAYAYESVLAKGVTSCSVNYP